MIAQRCTFAVLAAATFLLSWAMWRSRSETNRFPGRMSGRAADSAQTKELVATETLRDELKQSDSMLVYFVNRIIQLTSQSFD
jgi:hypothetical protein